MRTRIKICGITRPEDGLAAARAGADAIGLVFYPKSPRAVTIAQARAIIEVLPAFVTTVALFVDAEHFVVQDILNEVPIDLLQFHGAESPVACAAYGRPYIKAIRMRDDLDLTDIAGQYRGGPNPARGLLLDTYSANAAGGTGEVFDWARVPAGLDLPIILAGGLDPANVGEAILATRPYAVDVSSGVEAGKGIKDVGKMTAFIEAARQADMQ